MIESIHQSNLNMALRCWEQFRRRYIENEIIPPSVAAGRGRGVHKANEINLRQKVKTEEDLPIADLKDAARDGYVYAFRNGIYIPKEQLSEKEKLINQGLNETIRLTGTYREKVAPEIMPKEVERKFTIDIGLPLKLSGMIDIERTAKLDDLKTASKSWSTDRINSEIQPSFYCYVSEHETGIRPNFNYHILVALKKSEKHQIQSYKPTDNDYNALFSKLEIFCDMLKRGIFPPANPTSWWCSERWCGYWPTCKYVGNDYPQNWI